jgi:Aspartyl protease
MKLTRLALASVFSLMVLPTRAEETACRYEQGVVVIAAEVAGIAGDFILDTGTPATQIHETRAQSAGLAAGPLLGDVRMAGERLSGRAVEIADLDVRTWAFPTPIAGVIGADVLRGYVVDVDFRPCRVVLAPPGRAKPFAARQSLALTWVGGRPTARARISDGARTLEGDFALATGGDRAVRIDSALAGVNRMASAVELLPGGNLKPVLRAVSFAGELYQNVSAGVLAADETGPAGVIGPGVLERFSLRFDFPNNRLLLAPAAVPTP